MSEVRGRQFLASGARSVANHVAKAEASLNMECDRSLKYGGPGTQKSLGSWISAAASYCVGKCWLLTAGISLLIEDQKEIHRDKKSLIKGSGRLWPRLQQTCLLGSVCIHLGMQEPVRKWFLNFANSTLHLTVYSIIHHTRGFQNVCTPAHTRLIFPQSIKSLIEWCVAHKNEEHIWISKG